MKSSFNSKMAKALALTVALGSTAACTRIDDREVGIKTDINGRVVEKYSQGHGVEVYFPITADVYTYKTTLQTVSVQASEANLRTSDNQQVVGGVAIQFQVDTHCGDLGVFFSSYDNDYAEALRLTAKGVAVEVFGKQSSIKLTEQLSQTTETIKTNLQDKLCNQSVPIKIVNVISDGVGLSPEANKKLEDVMLEQQRTRVLELREDNAVKAQTVAVKEAAVTVGILKAFTDAGLTADQAQSALCLHLAEKEGSVNKPFTPGCFGNGQKPSIAIAQPK